MEKCSLLICANNSYLRAEEDLTTLTGIKVGHSSLHRLVQKNQLPEKVHQMTVHSLSIDGGKIKLRNPSQGKGEWRDYKAVSLDNGISAAYFQDNEKLLEWVNQQRLWSTITCLGDGHDGIWNIISGIRDENSRREVLDWYHLVENLHKLEIPKTRLKRLENYLWKGLLSETVEDLSRCGEKKVSSFLNYLNKHKDRIGEYELYQQLGIQIGSGSVESLVKQIGNRVKITGAQWKEENVPQILKLRCAYLNGEFSSSIYA